MLQSHLKLLFFSVETVDEFEGLPESENNVPEEEQRDPRYILGRKLLSLGKVNYRHIEHMPGWLDLRIKVL